MSDNKFNLKNSDISIVLPVYNEEGCIEIVYDKLVSTLSEIENNTEIIFVNDGSTDNSREVLNSIAKKDDRVKVIHLRRNFGQTAALSAGFDHSSGDVIVSLDSDGQNDPADIPELLSKLEDGFDVVNGWRKDRKDPFFMRKLPSYLGNWLIRVLTDVNLKDFGCTLKAYRKEVIEELSLYGEMHRMIPVLASLMGARITEIPVRHHPRPYGRSNYNNWRALSVVLDLVTLKFFSGYFTRPLHIFGLVGLISILLGFISFGVLVSMKVIYEIDMTGNPFLMLGALLAIVGTQLVMLGLIGEVSVRTYFESQEKPIYVIKEIREKK
jgi:glycosyltransferase involved in cell wall biosynthesis